MPPPAIAAHPALRFITPARGTHYRIPYFPQGIPAGFPSPGGRSLQKALDLVFLVSIRRSYSSWSCRTSDASSSLKAGGSAWSS